MQFTSLPFMLFFPAVVVIAFVLPAGLRRAWLLCASLAFYLYGGLKYGVFLFLSIAITWAAGLLLARCEAPGRRKLILAAGVLLDLSFLLFFKYYAFAAENAGALLAAIGWENPLPVFRLLMPVGISFYTFQSLGYVVDVYRGQTPAEKNIITYALFVAFFPQVQSGPISRSTTLLPQLQAPAPRFDPAGAREGLILMGWGLFKKLVVADRLAVFVDSVYATYPKQPGSILWVGALAFAVQLYCDFSGYTGMAMGAARVLGYKLDENFAQPYLSQSIAEFWRRWHITLGGWFKDYVFYPILRSRPFTAMLKKAKQSRLPRHLAKNLPVVLALLILWLATGLWHGAAWTFVAFGLWHGGLIIMGTLCAPLFKKLRAALHIPDKSLAFGAFGVLRTFFLVCLGFVFFRSASLGDAFAYLSGLFSSFGGAALADGTLLNFGLSAPELWAAVAGTAIVAATDVAAARGDPLAWLARRRAPLQWAVYLAGLMAIVIFGVYGGGQVDKPFIYFQF